MQLEWTIFAITDRDVIFEYIEGESPKNAILVDERIQSQVEALRQFPESGRPGRVEGTRELVIERTPFIVPYTVRGDIIRILRVLNGAQQWPDTLPNDSLID